MATDVMLRVLGPMEATAVGKQVPTGGPNRRTVMAVLLLARGAVVPVSRIIDEIWRDDPPRTAVVKVQGHICEIRKAFTAAGYQFGARVIETRSPGYRLDTHCCGSDLHDFLRLSTEATRLRHLGRAEESAAMFGNALRLWRGPAFANIGGEEVRGHAVRVSQLRLLALEDKATQDLKLGRFRTVLADLGPVVDNEPLRERSRELLIRAYLGLEQRHAAIRCYEAGRDLLRRDLGISPGAGLQKLAQSIRHAGQASTRSTVVARGTRASKVTRITRTAPLLDR